VKLYTGFVFHSRNTYICTMGKEIKRAFGKRVPSSLKAGRLGGWEVWRPGGQEAGGLGGWEVISERSKDRR